MFACRSFDFGIYTAEWLCVAYSSTRHSCNNLVCCGVSSVLYYLTAALFGSQFSFFNFSAFQTFVLAELIQVSGEDSRKFAHDQIICPLFCAYNLPSPAPPLHPPKKFSGPLSAVSMPQIARVGAFSSIFGIYYTCIRLYRSTIKKKIRQAFVEKSSKSDE